MLNFKRVTVFCLLILIALVIISLFLSVLFYLYVLVFLVWFSLTVIGSFNILWNYHLTAYHKNSSVSKKMVAITFDDGPNPVHTPKVLELLKQFNAQATFFCIGKEAEKHPDIIKKIIDNGHTLGNHTYNHSTNFGFMNTEQLVKEVIKTDEVIHSIIGEKMLLFRPPFGVTNPSVAKAIKKTQHKVIGWSVRSLDTVLKNDKKIADRVTKKLTSGDIILLHDTSDETVKALEQLLLFLQKENYKSVTVDFLLNFKAYE